MLQPSYTKQFERDLKKSKKRGKNLEKIRVVMELVLMDNGLPQKYKDHLLVGDYKGRRECHLEPDWLLIYKVDHKLVIFERTGTHADLFD